MLLAVSVLFLASLLPGSAFVDPTRKSVHSSISSSSSDEDLKITNQEPTVSLPIKSNDSKYPFPIIKRHIRSDEPPAAGQGLRLAVYQGPGLCGDRKAIEFNLNSLKQWAAAAKKEKAQILAVAELFLCGYNIRQDDRDEAAVECEEVVAMVSPIAKVNEMALVVPYAEKVQGDDRMYDSMVLVGKDGNLMRNYRKSQLWGSDEKSVWRYPYVDNPEDAYQVNEVNGIRVGLLNCYEAEFPELNRILALKGAQMILIPTAADVGTYDHKKKLWSNWAYPDVSKTIINANAYHSRIFCAYINHALYQFRSDGETMSGIYLGNSVVADPMGQTMVLAENVETLLVADCIPSDYPPLHPEGQSDFFKDRRPELYGTLTSSSITMNVDGSKHSYSKDPNA